MTDSTIDVTPERWADAQQLIPDGLLGRAASDICAETEDPPCEECWWKAREALTLPYLYSTYPHAEECLACQLMRTEESEYNITCLYHAGVDAGLLAGWQPHVTATQPQPARRGRAHFIRLCQVVGVALSAAGLARSVTFHQYWWVGYSAAVLIGAMWLALFRRP